MRSALERVAGAPISWGVCEVPGWGYQMNPDRVLREMVVVGLHATELGSDGFLPPSPEGKAETLATYGLHGLGNFTPVLLHDTDTDPVPEVERVLAGFDAVGADVLVLSAITGLRGYDARPDLDTAGWNTLLGNLDRLSRLAADRGVRAVLHPHVGTMVETGNDVQKVLEDSSISLCLDTGHLLIGGTDPAALTRQSPDRIAHTHLKDVDDALAKRVQAGELTYTEAVRAGMYKPLGQGDVDIAGVVGHLEANNYTGWYVLEQDAILDEEPRGEGPVADVRASAEYVRSVIRGL
ncbi:sugar phosphate isomerase/epimerase [Actinoplanes sp. NPDC051475]|uniref:sugar phosphate isomerase/epimerase family protein n=1 Tax=Actinoplanes sp. NPDC051475 TaxID=3157225 RepID=UPI00344FB21A